MPAQPNMNERFYPTLYDYHNAENPEGLAIIDETFYESHFLTNAMMKPTNDGLRERYRREDEMTYNPHAASLDEGYYASEKQVVTGKELSFDTMRISDSITWERKQRGLSPDNGQTLKDKQMRALLDAMIKKKVNYMIYGQKGNDNGLSIDGLNTYVSKTYSRAEFDHMNDVMDHYLDDQNYSHNPWDNHLAASGLDSDHDLLCFSNQADPDGANSLYKADGTGSVTAKDNTVGRKFTSIYGVAFGETGVVTVFPSIVNGAGGYVMDYTENINDKYQDPRDGQWKAFKSDRYDIDSYFGIGVKNRFCLSRLANIYLGHTDRDARKAEMKRIEDYLIMMKDFFDKGHTGMQMQFYCSDRLITEMERYQKEMYPNQYISVGNREFNGMNVRQRPKTINVTSDIVLLSDSVFKTNEAFI